MIFVTNTLINRKLILQFIRNALGKRPAELLILTGLLRVEAKVIWIIKNAQMMTLYSMCRSSVYSLKQSLKKRKKLDLAFPYS